MSASETRRLERENQRLAAELRSALARIDELSRSLEQQVAERTRQLEEANARLQQLSITDDVTGLYNQRYLRARLLEEFGRAQRHGTALAVMMLDLDHFKEVNDTHDHLFGSRVLRRIGKLMSAIIRSSDMLVRYGGDEFVLVLPHTNLSEAMSLAERLRMTVATAEVGDEGAPWCVSMSIGISALHESNADSPRALLEAADRALYLAKGQGRNRVAVSNNNHIVAVVA